MTRIDMTTREWHELIRPVLPHVGTDQDSPEIGAIRVEVAERAMYAVATDRYTLAAERHEYDGGQLAASPPAPIHIVRSDAAASLKVFGFSKDDDPPLQIIIDHVPVRTQMAGRPLTMEQLAITIQSSEGTRLVLHDHRNPSLDPLAGWRKTLRQVVCRGPVAIHAGLALHDGSIPVRDAAIALDALGGRGNCRQPSVLRVGKPQHPGLALGAVLAVAEVTGCHDDGSCYGALQRPGSGLHPLCSPWAQRFQWHIQLANVQALADPVPCRGMLGLWRLPEDVGSAVRAQLEAG